MSACSSGSETDAIHSGVFQIADNQQCMSGKPLYWRYLRYSSWLHNTASARCLSREIWGDAETLPYSPLLLGKPPILSPGTVVAPFTGLAPWWPSNCDPMRHALDHRGVPRKQVNWQTRDLSYGRGKGLLTGMSSGRSHFSAMGEQQLLPWQKARLSRSLPWQNTANLWVSSGWAAFCRGEIVRSLR